jgi:hypothetical protein
MIKIFVGGSRRVTSRGAEVRRRLDEIIERRLPVLAGNANGVDKAVQQHSKERQHSQVEVFCMEGLCRKRRWPLANSFDAGTQQREGFRLLLHQGPAVKLKGGDS